MKLLLLIALLGLGMCGKDETVAAYGGAGQVWVLSELDGAAFEARATLSFPEPGKIAGDGPCNRYSGVMTTPYPWFDVGEVMSARMACPDLQAEAAFFEALSEMTESEVSGGTLILRNEARREMLFTAAA